MSMTPRLRDTLIAIANGMNTNAKLSQALGVHVNTVGLYAKRLAKDGYIASAAAIESVDDRFKDSARVKLRRYTITPKGEEQLTCSS